MSQKPNQTSRRKIKVYTFRIKPLKILTNKIDEPTSDDRFERALLDDYSGVSEMLEIKPPKQEVEK